MALVTHRIDIVRADTALHIAEPRSERMLLSQQVRHQGLHARHIEKNAGGAVGYQRYRSHVHMSSLDIKLLPCSS